MVAWMVGSETEKKKIVIFINWDTGVANNNYISYNKNEHMFQTCFC